MREEGANLKAEQDGSHLKRHLSKQLLKDRCGSVNNSRGNVVQTEGKPRVLTYVRDNKKKKKNNVVVPRGSRKRSRHHRRVPGQRMTLTLAPVNKSSWLEKCL